MSPIISIAVAGWDAISRWVKVLFDVLGGLSDLLDGLSAIWDVLCVVAHVVCAILQVLELFAGFF
jgi:hypothetical protein